MSPAVPIPEHLHALLAGRPIAFVTTMRPDGRMSTTPMALIYDGETIRLSTPSYTKKVRNLKADARITICVVQPDDLQRYVEIRGRARLEADPERSFIDRVAKQYMDLDRYPYDRPGDERIVITVIPEKISAPRVRAPRPPAPKT